ncbi:MAG: peptidyl-prolyl cis-trans isomerase [Acidobacteriota bacterium]
MKIVAVPLAVSLGALLPVLAQVPPAENRRVVETVKAKVNDEIITAQSFDRTMTPKVAALRDKLKDKPQEMLQAIERAKTETLETMIDNLLLVQKARSDGIKVGEDEITEVMNRMMLENGIGSQEDLVIALRAEGIEFDDFKDDLRNQGYREHLISQEILRKISVTDSEIQKFYDENGDKFDVPARTRIREIGLGDDRAKAEELLAKVNARLKGGAKFEDVATDMSLAPSKDAGGDLGWNSKGDLDSSIEAAAEKLAPGQTSPLVASAYGFKVIRVEERQAAGKRPLAEVHDSVEDYLRRKLYDEQLRAFIEKLRADADIRVKDEKGVLVEWKAPKPEGAPAS